MTWRFSDETVVRVGGNVEGASLFAQELREALADDPVLVAIWPEPAGGVELNRTDPALLDFWLREQMKKPYRRALGLRLLEAPADLLPLPPAPVDEDDEPADEAAVY